MTVGVWNVRGMNKIQKKQYLQWAITEAGLDVAMFNETKLTSACVFQGFHSHQTLDIKRGGCATFTTTHLHKKVKALSTYMLWTRIPIGCEQLHLINVYIEPGQSPSVLARMKRVVEVVDDIIRQYQGSRIVLGGDLNAQRERMNTELVKRGFTPTIVEGTPTHRDGNHLDQIWVRNLSLVKAVLAERVDKVSDHHLVKIVVGAEVRHKQDQVTTT